jgi:hypothetical protein
MNQLTFDRFKPNSPSGEFETVTAENRNHKRRVFTPMGQDEADKRNRGEFLSWRANWRRGYKNIVESIRALKAKAKDKTTSENKRRSAQEDLIVVRATARAMMMALEASKHLYRIEHGTKFSRNVVKEQEGHKDYLDLAESIVTGKLPETN